MAVPSRAVEWPQPMDPGDFVEFYFNLRGEEPVLEPAETVTSFTVSLPADSTALGLEISQAAGSQPELLSGGSLIVVWLSVAPAERENSLFYGEGVALPVTFVVNTSNTPSRRRERTMLARIVQS